MIDRFGSELLCAVLAARLTPNQREAFIDIAVLGRTGAATAAAMGVTQQMASIHYRLARAKLAAVDGLREQLAA